MNPLWVWGQWMFAIMREGYALHVGLHDAPFCQVFQKKEYRSVIAVPEFALHSGLNAFSQFASMECGSVDSASSVVSMARASTCQRCVVTSAALCPIIGIPKCQFFVI